MTVLIDPDGKVVARADGPADWDDPGRGGLLQAHHRELSLTSGSGGRIYRVGTGCSPR